MRSFGFPDFVFLVQAFQWTVLLSVIAMALGGIVGLGIALMRISRFRPLRWAAAGYIQVVQGVPLLGLLMFSYFGIPAFLGINVPSMVAVSAAYTIWAASFFGEIWRAGIQSIKKSQWEAAACLGITRWQQFRHVIGPQALRVALPPTVGFIVQMIKGTSLAAIIGFVELTRAGQIISAATFAPLLVYSIIGIIYLCVCFPLTQWSRNLEDRLHGAG